MAEHDFGSRAVPCLDASALSGLAERVAAATGADREIDAAVWSALGAKRDVFHNLTLGNWSPRALNVTASLDAALALVERVLPGWGGFAGFGSGSKLQEAYLCGPVKEIGTDEDGEDVVIHDEATGEAPTPALALLSALLAALAAGAKDDADG